MNVLIIEDDDATANVFRSRFEAIGLTVEIAASFEEAMRMLASSVPLPHIITVDINLADTVGEQTIMRVEDIRRNAPDAVILIISGVLHPADAPRLAKLGADASFEKMDLTTEKSWWQKVCETLSGIGNQTDMHRNLEHVRTLAAKATEKYNELGASLRLTTPDEKKD